MFRKRQVLLIETMSPVGNSKKKQIKKIKQLKKDLRKVGISAVFSPAGIIGVTHKL